MNVAVILNKYKKHVPSIFIVCILFLMLIVSQNTTYSIALAGVPKDVVPKGDDFYSVRSLLTQIAPLEYITLTSQKPYIFNSKIGLLVCFDNNTPVSDTQKKEVEKFLNNGGSAIFMVDGIYIPSGGKPTTASHNLFTLFSKYGITLDNDLVVSHSSEIASISTSQTAFASAYPLWVKTTNFNKTKPEFNAISSLVFPWSSSVSVNKNAEILVQSEKDSWVQKDQFSLAPNEVPIAPVDTQQAYGLVAQSTTKSGGSILVIPSSRFVREQFLSTPPENPTFIANIAKKYIADSSRQMYISHLINVLTILFGIILVLSTVFVVWRSKNSHNQTS